MASTTPSMRFHAVSVVGGDGACAAAKLLRGVRVLSASAPRLPLPDCDHPGTCNCSYRKYADRRAGPRRAQESGRVSGPWSATNRRRSTGRRETD